MQTPHLFSGTVLENLRYGRPDATMEEIKAAVRSVSAEDVIARMDNCLLYTSTQMRMIIRPEKEIKYTVCL